VHVYKKGRRVKTFKVVVGKPSTPTPRGEFFIEEGLRLPRKHVGYPYALATSARSHVFKEFMGGPGQIAFHGIVNIPGSKMGTATSNGCIRMTTPAIMWMAKHIKAGTPLTVR
jgi:lipoprotein-anchoring transpeptidase ErfK/SrfK